ncbi:hypothetical protein [Ferrovibrio xuzhouensis]|uniref:Uncharacterized protein n=1 Tax=Ferrovibrio xuzhouensis TaxID=1576914 RepID=A0ABV7VD06_9PROT
MTDMLDSILPPDLAEDARAVLTWQRDPPLWDEAFDNWLKTGTNAAVAPWLTEKVGLDLVLVTMFRMGVARIAIDPLTGLWTPVGRADAEDGGQPAVTLPVLADPDDRHSIVDIVAFDPDDLNRFWLRTGLADLLGEAALAHAVIEGRPLRLYPTPWAWLRGWGEARLAWRSERRSAEADCRAMAVKAAVETGRTGWEWLRWAETTLRVWFDQRLPAMPVPGLHGVCVLSGAVNYEHLFAAVPALVADGEDHAAWLAERMAMERRRRRAAEKMPKIGFIKPSPPAAVAAA